MRLLFVWVLISSGFSAAFAQRSLCFQYTLPSGWTEKSSHSPGFDSLFIFSPTNRMVLISIQSFDYDQPELYLKSSAEQFIGTGNMQQKMFGSHNGFAIEGTKEWYYLFLCKSSDNEDRIVTISIANANEWEQSEHKVLNTMLSSMK